MSRTGNLAAGLALALAAGSWPAAQGSDAAFLLQRMVLSAATPCGNYPLAPPCMYWECTAGGWELYDSPAGTRCSDGKACTYGDHCDGTGTCVGTIAARGTPCPTPTACGQVCDGVSPYCQPAE